MIVAADTTRDLDNTDRIAGWLVLPAFGLLLGFGRELLEAVKLASGFIHGPSLEWGIQLAILAPWLAFSVVVGLFFFRRHRWAPYFFIAYLVGNLAFGGLYLLTHILVPEPASADAPKEMTRAFVSACIWIPYFLRSRRVKITFVRSWWSLA